MNSEKEKAFIDAIYSVRKWKQKPETDESYPILIESIKMGFWETEKDFFNAGVLAERERVKKLLEEVCGISTNELFPQEGESGE